MFGTDQPIAEFRGPWGVPVQVGGSIVFLVLLFVGVGVRPGDMVYDLIFLAIVIASILLHELGHAWGCLVQGIPVRRIMLHGGGGFCEHARAPGRHEAELIVAMGPIVNLALWAVAGLIAPTMEWGTARWAVETVAWVNLWLALFNLVPVQPLDGGRLFHLALARLMPADRASRIAGTVGFVIALVWIPAMVACFLLTGFLLIFIPGLAAQRQLMEVRRGRA